MDRPMMFTGAMVQALRAGHKRQTRRMLSPQPEYAFLHNGVLCYRKMAGGKILDYLPRIQPGDRLFVRESYAMIGGEVVYAADDVEIPKGMRKTAMFMPRALSRMTLTVTASRHEQLQDITEADAVAEGVTLGRHSTAKWAFRDLWNEINGDRLEGAWERNPWVLVVKFDVHHINIDALREAAE